MADLERIGDGLGHLLRRMGMPTVPDLDRLSTEWDQLAGEPWSGRSRPAGFRDGELVLGVSDGASATLLRYQVDALLDRLERQLGGRVVTAVRIRLENPKKGS